MGPNSPLKKSVSWFDRLTTNGKEVNDFNGYSVHPEPVEGWVKTFQRAASAAAYVGQTRANRICPAYRNGVVFGDTISPLSLRFIYSAAEAAAVEGDFKAVV